MGQFDPRTHDPTLIVGIEAIVVVAMNRPNRGVAILGLELDDANATEVGTHRVDVLAKGRCHLGVRGPERVFVGLALVPETATVELTISRRERCEVGVTTALPVHVLEALPLGRRNIDGHGAQLNEARLVEHLQTRMRGVQRDLDRPVILIGPESRAGRHGVSLRTHFEGVTEWWSWWSTEPRWECSRPPAESSDADQPRSRRDR